jgi:hypothetical protein
MVSSIQRWRLRIKEVKSLLKITQKVAELGVKPGMAQPRILNLYP